MNLETAILLGIALGVAWAISTLIVTWVAIRSILWILRGIYHWFIEGFVSNCTHSWNMSDW